MERKNVSLMSFGKLLTMRWATKYIWVKNQISISRDRRILK